MVRSYAAFKRNWNDHLSASSGKFTGRKTRDLNQRGVSIKAGHTLHSLYKERIPLYENIQTISIDCAGKEIRELRF